MSDCLTLVAYGTIIPDIRTLLYEKQLDPGLATEVSERVFELDSLLRGRDNRQSSMDRPPDRILFDVYAEQAVDPGLLQVLDKAQKANCEIEVATHVENESKPPGDELLERFLYQMSPPGRNLPKSLVSPRAHARQTIWIVRHMDRAERLLRDREQVILYETPDRLERELNLRGVMGVVSESI